MPQSCLQSQMNLSMNGDQDQVSVISDVFLFVLFFAISKNIFWLVSVRNREVLHKSRKKISRITELVQFDLVNTIIL